ncbi:FtsK/SpoIIIE domain-containing protein [Geodermatophilus sp. SYSU D00815]
MTETRAASRRRPPSTRCWTLWSPDGAVDVELTASDEGTLASVLPALGHALGAPVEGLWAGSTRLPDDLPLTAAQLRHGAALGWGRPGPRPPSDRRTSALELHVVGGPEAGRTEPLGQGRHVLGRGAGARFRLDDPDVSRRHAQITVESGRITVADLGSTNGSRLGDTDLRGTPTAWTSGSVLRTGASAVTVRGPEGGTAALRPAPGGRQRLRLAPRLAEPRQEVEVRFPRPPAPPPRRRLAWIAVAVPLVAGVAMAWLLRTPQFLFFALLSPVMAVGTWWSERWSGRREGRRQAAEHLAAVAEAERRLAAAVSADRLAVELASPDLAALTTAARRRSSRVWERRRGDTDALHVRLGTGSGPCAVVRVMPDGDRRRETVGHLPVVLDLRAAAGLSVVGPRAAAAGVLAAVVAQVAVLHGPDEVQLALVADDASAPDWQWVRWLPQLQHASVAGPDAAAADEQLRRWVTRVVAARRAALDERAGPSAGEPRLPWLLVVLARPVDPGVAAALRAGRDVGVGVLTTATTAQLLPATADAVLALGGETGARGTLRRAGQADVPEVVVDRLPRGVADELARDLAVLEPAGAAATLPREVRLLDLPAPGVHLDDDGRTTGRWNRARDTLTAPVGRTAEGVVSVDLGRQGPHALVAGTTGSGKSELLQTLIAGLALHHPPDRCSFLLVDYKGGAAFADAVSLPHTVGLVTDLDGPATERALRSLGAELTRRESVLAAHGVTDVSALPAAVDLARLVIVVDEFAALAEEHPSFVPGLVGIAQRGRSLGVHLVLATQRPGGVVSPEIRANCSLRICLRTADEAEARDVIGTSRPAFLPVDLPGRALLRTGSAPPVEFQVARAATPVPEPDAGPVVRRWHWAGGGPAGRGPGRSRGGSDLARLSAALRRRAADDGEGAPHRPWQPPLPSRLPAEALDEAVPGRRSGARLRIGLLDRPDAQVQEPLELDLADGGGWLAVGGPRSGRTTLLRTVLAEAVHRRAPEELHVHVLDHGGGALAGEAAGLPHTGTAVGADDPFRAVRLVARLGEEVAARRAGRAAGAPAPALLLLVDGLEAAGEQLDQADPGQGSAALLRLVRDGAAVGLTCVLTADRAVPGGRLASVAGRRLVLPLADRADYAVAGIPVRLVPEARPPGRALLGEAGQECQLALPRPVVRETLRPPDAAALRIAALPADPRLPLPSPAGADGPADPALLPVGPGGDEGRVLSVDLRRTGGLLVAGPPGSGRTAALEAFATHLRHAGFAVLLLAPGPPADLPGWAASLRGRPGAVVVDDVATFGDAPLLTTLPGAGATGRVVVLAAGQAADLGRHYQGPLADLRRSRSGLLLTPGPGDADLLGIRLPRVPVPARPGSGWLVVAGTPQRVQVARHRDGE